MQNCKKSLTCWKTEKPTQKSFNKNWTNYFPCYWGCCTRDLFRRMGCYIRDFLISGATAPYFLGDSFLSFFPSICSGINIADLHQFRKHTHIIVRKFHNQSPMLFYNSLAFLTFRGHTCLLIFICRLTMISAYFLKLTACICNTSSFNCSIAVKEAVSCSIFFRILSAEGDNKPSLS